jgi:hypothetical protein
MFGSPEVQILNMADSNEERLFQNFNILATYAHQGLDRTDVWVDIDGSDLL